MFDAKELNRTQSSQEFQFFVEPDKKQKTTVRVQNISPQNIPLGHIGYFELKVLEKQLAQEHPDSAFSP